MKKKLVSYRRPVFLSAAKLEKLRNQLEGSLFEANFREAETLVRKIKWARVPSGADQFLSLRIKAMASEVLDYFGSYEAAKLVIQTDGEECERVLRGLVDKGTSCPANDNERELLKQQIWVVLHWGFGYYRRGQLGEARSRFRLCLTVARNLLTTNHYRAEGTMARIHYLIGLLDREAYDYQGAIHNFTESMRFAWQTLARNSGTRRRLASGAGATLRDVNLARCMGLGLAWVHYTLGNLEAAIPLLLGARALILNAKEDLIKAYIDVVYASVLRSGDGDKPETLEEAIKLLQQAAAVFEQGNTAHTYYTIRAAHQLALAYLQKARNATRERDHRGVQKALEHTKSYARQMKTLAAELNDLRFRCDATVIQSLVELHCGRLIEAEQMAREALEEGYEHIFCRVDALMARGEARLQLGNYAGGCQDFEAALEVAHDNPKVQAMCHLFLAQAHAQNRNLRGSTQQYEEFLRLKKTIKTAFVRKLQTDAEQALKEEGEDFTIHWSADKLDTKKLEQELHAFLTRWARKQTNSDAEAATLLKISKQTLYNWQGQGQKQQILGPKIRP